LGAAGALKGFRDIEVRIKGDERILGISAATVSKAVRLGSKLPETAKIQRQILGN